MRIIWDRELFHSWGNKPKQKAREKQYNAEYYKKEKWRWEDNKNKKHKSKGKKSSKKEKDSKLDKQKIESTKKDEKKKSKDKKSKKPFEQESVTKVRVAYGNKGKYIGTETIRKQKMVRVPKPRKPKKRRGVVGVVNPLPIKIKDANKHRIKRGRKKLKNFINKNRRS